MRRKTGPNFSEHFGRALREEPLCFASQINSLQIDDEGLRERLTRILGRLETLPTDSQRSVFNNLIQYCRGPSYQGQAWGVGTC